jgi:tetratricopeptide (TPR) repeat protein
VSGAFSLWLCPDSKERRPKMIQVNRRKYLEQSIEQFHISLHIKPDNTDSYFGLGLAYQTLGNNIDSALHYCKLCTMQGTTSESPYECLGVIYNTIGRHRLSSYSYNKAFALNPYNTEVSSNRNNHFLNTGLDIKNLTSKDKYDDSLPVSNTEKEYIASKQIGLEYGKKGDFQNALKYLQKAVDLNPQSVQALVNLAICYVSINNYPKSIET